MIIGIAGILDEVVTNNDVGGTCTTADRHATFAAVFDNVIFNNNVGYRMACVPDRYQYVLSLTVNAQAAHSGVVIVNPEDAASGGT